MASNSGGQQGVFTFIKSKRGKEKLLRAGHQYNKNITNKDGSINWRCIKRDICNGSLTLSRDQQSIIRESKHVCLPDYSQNEVDTILDKCKQKVQESLEAVPKIYERCFEEIYTSDSDGIEVPDFNSKADALYNIRKKALGISKINFKTINEVKFPQILTENFLIHESDADNNFFVFATSGSLKLLEETDLVFADGTFCSTPDPFYQLFTLHIDTGSSRESVSIVPVVFCLLLNKQQNTYEKLFTVLKEKIALHIGFFKCDYEVALINAVKAVFPQVKVKGCFYHFYSAISKKGKEIGMLQDIEERDSDEERRRKKAMAKVVWNTVNLALLPRAYIPEAWLSITEKAPDCEESEYFKKYFINQWVQKISADMWCCAQERHRTTNALERWHRKLKSKLIGHKNNLFLFVKTLKKEAIFYKNKVRREIVGDTLKKRRTKEIIKDAKIEKIVENLIKGKISTQKRLSQLAWVKNKRNF